MAIGFAPGLALSNGLALLIGLALLAGLALLNGLAEALDKGAVVAVWSWLFVACASEACGSSAHPSASKAAIVNECFIAVFFPGRGNR